MYILSCTEAGLRMGWDQTWDQIWGDIESVRRCHVSMTISTWHVWPMICQQSRQTRARKHAGEKHSYFILCLNQCQATLLGEVRNYFWSIWLGLSATWCSTLTSRLKNITKAAMFIFNNLPLRCMSDSQHYSKNLYPLRSRIIPNGATIGDQEPWGRRLSGSWSLMVA